VPACERGAIPPKRWAVVEASRLQCGAPAGTLSSVDSPIAYFSLYPTLYGAFGVASPFWPKFLETKGLSSAQIALIFGAALLIRLISGPLVGALADLLTASRIVLASCAGLAAAAALALLSAHTFWLLMILVLIQAAALAPTTSIADALSVNRANLQIAGARFEYGWVRGAGPAAFALGTLIMGQLISSTDLSPVVWMDAGLLLAAVGATAILPMPATRLETRTRRSPGIIELRRLLDIARFRTLVLVAALVLGSHAMNDTFAVIRWSDAGITQRTLS
jgi:PPP family 3-phenylpropionic acid transporter